MRSSPWGTSARWPGSTASTIWRRLLWRWGRARALLANHPSASNLWAAGRHAAAYAAWLAGEEVRHTVGRFRQRLTAVPAELADVALGLLGDLALDISAALRHFGAAIAHRQALVFDLARRAQLATVMLVVSRYADRQSDPWVRQAGLCAALELGARLTGAQPTGETYHLVTELGRAVAEEQFPVGRDAERGAVVMAEHLAS